MSAPTTLNILQLNSHRSYHVLRPLLLDERALACDVLLIQEPWRNPYMHTTHNPAKDVWSLVYAASPDTRACIFINKRRIAQDQWTPVWIDPDSCAVQLSRPGDSQPSITIISAYNPPPDRDEPGPLLSSIDLHLQANPELSILMGDFNLHHPSWAGPEYHHCHRASRHLLQLASSHDLQLLTPPGTVTFDNGYQSTIDLAFCSTGLANSVVACTTTDEVAHDSDHYATILTMDINFDAPPPTPRRRWRDTDFTKLRDTFQAEAERMQLLTQPLLTTDNIDLSVQGLTDAMRIAIETATPLSSPHARSKPSFTTACKQACRDAQRRRRRWQQTRTDADRTNYILAVK
jgi:hypothetical protein